MGSKRFSAKMVYGKTSTNDNLQMFCFTSVLLLNGRSFDSLCPIQNELPQNDNVVNCYHEWIYSKNTDQSTLGNTKNHQKDSLKHCAYIGSLFAEPKCCNFKRPSHQCVSHLPRLHFHRIACVYESATFSIYPTWNIDMVCGRPHFSNLF